MTPQQAAIIESRVTAMEKATVQIAADVAAIKTTVDGMKSAINENSEILKTWNAIRQGGKAITWASGLLTAILGGWLIIKAGVAALLAVGAK